MKTSVHSLGSLLLWIAPVWGLGCNRDSTLQVNNQAPEVTFVTPADGQAFHAAEEVTLIALVEDSETALEDLTLTWTSTLQGTLEEELLYSEVGVTMVLPGMTTGQHAVVLKATDARGKTGEDSLSISIEPNEAPQVSILAPEPGERLVEGYPSLVSIEVSDDFETDLASIVLEWSGLDEAGTLPLAASSDGTLSTYLTVAATGTYELVVTATDSLDEQGSASVAFEVSEPDLDGDGYADSEFGGDDCNDGDASINPGAEERCDEVDNDCDGLVDEPGAIGGIDAFPDEDGDGYGSDEDVTSACELLSGHVDSGGDCDDARSDVHPDATELCDEVDNDCDGTTDENDADDVSTWYEDADGDAYGNEASSVIACWEPAGYVADATDCDDSTASVSPGNSEYCNGYDDDCDGDVDEASAADATTWYGDSDGDGYGGTTDVTVDCTAPSGFVATSSDCDDTDASVSPDATEVCDGIDNDCDGSTDGSDAADASTWYIDTDGDGYGSPSSTSTACEELVGFSATSDDCDDSDSTIHPSADEYCNGLDDDCDGTIDETGVVDGTTWYLDSDGDGFGDPSRSTTACSEPSGYVADSTDCDDSHASAYPGASETWYDGIDGDCDGASDYDADGDGYDHEDYGGSDCYDDDASAYPGSSWSVPGDYATIQDAIDGACTTDTIEVSAGTYVENLDYGDKVVYVIGVDGAGSTFIDGDANGVPVVTLRSGSLESVTVTNGLAWDGAGIYVDASDGVELVDLVVSDNIASEYGGGIYVYQSKNVTLDDSTISDNAAGGYGGGVAVYDCASGSEAPLTVTNTLLEGNDSDQGGGIYVGEAGYSGLVLDQVTLTENTGAYGAALYAMTSYIEVLDSTVSANANDSGCCSRAVIYGSQLKTRDADGAPSLFDGLTFSENTAPYGILIPSGTVELTNMWVTDNELTEGVAVHVSGSFEVHDSLLENNSNTSGGATVLGISQDTSSTLHDLVIRNNTGQLYSGIEAYTLSASTEIGLYNIEVTGNLNTGSSYTEFGVVILYGNGWADNIVVAGNSGGMKLDAYSSSHIQTLTNATIVGNDYDGLMVSSTWYSQIHLTNVISAYNGRYGIDNTGSYEPELSYSDVYGNGSGDYNGMTDPTGSDGNISADPDLHSYSSSLPLSQLDLHLAPGSSLFDAGDPGITDGDGSSSDIGAYSGDYADYSYFDDADGDGMWDGWETDHGLDSSFDDSGVDSDGDGLDNAAEFAQGTDPASADTDGDGEDDGFEVSGGTDPLAH